MSDDDEAAVNSPSSSDLEMYQRCVEHQVKQVQEKVWIYRYGYVQIHSKARRGKACSAV